MTRAIVLATAVVAVVVLGAAGAVLLDGGATGGSSDAPQRGTADGPVANDSALRGDEDGIRFASCTRAVVDADGERVEVELTAYDGGTQLHTYENVSGVTAFTVSKAGRSPDRWFISGIGVGQGYDYVAALNPYYSRGRSGESSCGSENA